MLIYIMFSTSMEEMVFGLRKDLDMYILATEMLKKELQTIKEEKAALIHLQKKWLAIDNRYYNMVKMMTEQLQEINGKMEELTEKKSRGNIELHKELIKHINKNRTLKKKIKNLQILLYNNYC
nr:hypothetical protein Datr000037 [Darna trima granulovirus]